MQAHKLLRKIGAVALSAVLCMGASVNVGAIYSYDGNYEYNFYETEDRYGVYIDRIYDVKTKVIVKERINDLNVVMLQTPEQELSNEGGELKNIFGQPSKYYAVVEGEEVPTKFYDETFNDVTETVILPNELKIIGMGAFFDCRKLSKINIPDGVEKIGEYAFYKCRFLKSIELPASVTEVGVNAFEKTGIKQIKIDNPELDISKAAVPNDAEVTAAYDSKAYEYISAQNKRGGNFTFNEVVVPLFDVKEAVIGMTDNDKSDSLKLNVKADKKASKGSETFTLKSSDTDVITVSKDGTVKAVNIGTAYVVATSKSGGESRCKVTVKKAPSQVKIKKELTINKNSMVKLTATIPINTASNKITFTSSNKKVCTVTESGLVKGVARGSANITVKTYNGKTATCKVKVLDPSIIDAKSLTLDKTSIIIGKGESFTLTPTVSPVNTTDKTVTYSSSDRTVAVVSNGKVTGKGVGTATITVKTVNGKTASCKVTVKKAPDKKKKKKTELWLGVGESFRLWSHISAGMNSNMRAFSSSNEAVCTVSENGTVTGKKIGTATVTVKTYNGKTASCKITVKQSATQITLDKYRVDLKVGQTFRLATHVPGNSASATRTFSSTNTKVCTVDKSGVITAKSKGTSVIRVQTFNGKKVSCQVVVK